MTDTAARGHWVQPVLSQRAPWDSRLDEASFKREMPERQKINWATVNRLTVGGKRHSEKEKQQGAILCLSWKMSQTLLPHLLLPLYFLPTCQLHCHLMALLVWAGMGAGRKTGAELSIHRQTFTSAEGVGGGGGKSLVSASFLNEWESFPSLLFLFLFLKKEGFSKWKWDKNKKKKSAEIRVFHPPLCLFQSTWMPEPMQETAWSSGGRAAGGLPPVSLPVAVDRSVHWQQSYELHQLLILQRCSTSERERQCLLPSLQFTQSTLLSVYYMHNLFWYDLLNICSWQCSSSSSIQIHANHICAL